MAILASKLVENEIQTYGLVSAVIQLDVGTDDVQQLQLYVGYKEADKIEFLRILSAYTDEAVWEGILWHNDGTWSLWDKDWKGNCFLRHSAPVMPIKGVKYEI